MSRLTAGLASGLGPQAFRFDKGTTGRRLAAIEAILIEPRSHLDVFNCQSLIFCLEFGKILTDRGGTELDFSSGFRSGLQRRAPP
jgi:hypothetical protein